MGRSFFWIEPQSRSAHSFLGSDLMDGEDEFWHLPGFSSDFSHSAIYCTMCKVYVNGRSQYIDHTFSRKHIILYRRAKRSSQQWQQEEEEEAHRRRVP